MPNLTSLTFQSHRYCSEKDKTCHRLVRQSPFLVVAGLSIDVIHLLLYDTSSTLALLFVFDIKSSKK